MKVVETVAAARFRVVDRPAPAPGTQALVRVQRAGICGTDLKVLEGRVPVSYPRVMGHEMVGTVLESGSGGFVPAGTRVMIDPATTCGHCDQCRKGRFNTCRNGGLMGRDSDGVFSELVAVSPERLHPIADSVTEDAAALLQVLGTCVHGQSDVDLSPEATAVVVGLGVSGLLHLQLLLAKGVRRVVGVTRSSWKLDLAREFGAMATAVPEEAAKAVDELTDGRGADLVIEAAGTEQTLARSIELAGLGSTVVVFGTITHGSEGLPYYDLYHKELTIRNPRAAIPHDYDVGIRLVAEGVVDPAPLLTHAFPVERAGEAFEAVRGADSLKVVLNFEGGR